MIHQIRRGEESRHVIRIIIDIFVQRDILDMIETMTKHRAFPRTERGHAAARGSANREFDRRIDPFHHFCRLGGDSAVIIGGARVHLPGPVHLIPQTPEFDAVRRIPAVRAAEIGQHRAMRMIAIL